VNYSSFLETENGRAQGGLKAMKLRGKASIFLWRELVLEGLGERRGRRVGESRNQFLVLGFHRMNASGSRWGESCRVGWGIHGRSLGWS